MTFWTRLARFLTPFDRDGVFRECELRIEREEREGRSQRLWLIENRQESLRYEIETAKRQKRATRHLADEMKRLTTERLTLEKANG